MQRPEADGLRCDGAGLFFGPAIGGYFKPVQVSPDSSPRLAAHQRKRAWLCALCCSRRSVSCHNAGCRQMQGHVGSLGQRRCGAPAARACVQVGWIATGGLLGCVAYALLFLKESLDGQSKIQAGPLQP